MLLRKQVISTSPLQITVIAKGLSNGDIAIVEKRINPIDGSKRRDVTVVPYEGDWVAAFDAAVTRASQGAANHKANPT